MALAEVRRGPGIKNRNLSRTAGITAEKLNPSYRFVHDDMKGRWNGCQSDGTVASEVDAEINYLRTGRGTVVEKLNVNTQVSGFPFPALATVGTDLAVGNQTSAQGAEFVFGGNNAMGNYVYTTGTDDCFIRMTFKVEDVGGGDIWVGFRKVATFGAAITSYADYAAVFYDGTASTAAGTTKTQTNVGAAGAVTTDMVLATADNDVLTAEVRVDKGGNVTYLFNGVANSVAPAYQFTSALTIVPFFAYLNTADVVGKIDCSALTIGPAETNVR